MNSQTTTTTEPRIGDTRPAPKRRNQNKKSNKKKRSKQEPVEANAGLKKKQSGSSKSARPNAEYRGRYQMLVHRGNSHTHTAVMQGKQLTEYAVSRDDYTEEEIFGNIYMGIARNIYVGTEMAFLDIGTFKNAVLHRGDMINTDEYEQQSTAPPIDAVLRPNQHVLCQVIKNPIAHKGARLTQEISLPGRYVILMLNKTGFAISRSIPDSEKKRLRRSLEGIKPEQHGLILRTEATTASDADIKEDLSILLEQWKRIEETSKKSVAPSLIYRGANATFRNIRDKFNEDYRSMLIDDWGLYEEIRNYLESVAPNLVDRVEYYDAEEAAQSLFDQKDVSAQLQKSLNSRVWLPSGGELVIERTEALTVVDVNTAKNTGVTNLEDTALQTNLEAANEVVRQLRLRNIGGIIVIDFIDLRDKKSRKVLMQRLRDAASQDPTKTHIEDVSNFGIVQMTRKRIGEDLQESFSTQCEECNGIGYHLKFDFMGVNGGEETRKP